MDLSRRFFVTSASAAAASLILPESAEAKRRKAGLGRAEAKKVAKALIETKDKSKAAAPSFDFRAAADVPAIPQTDGNACLPTPSLHLDAAKQREAKAKAPAPNYVIQDARGTILTASNADIRRHNASTTKMMLLDATMRMMKAHPVRFNMGSAVEIPQAVKELRHDLYMLPLKPGKSYRVRDLMIGCGTFSCAASTQALTAHLGRFLKGESEHDRIDATISHLNEMTQIHGMDNTSIRNAIGAPDKNHYSTTLDMAKLALIMERDFPETSREVMGQPHPLTVWGPRQHTSGYFRAHPDHIKFCKTGTTNAAGRCLAGVATNKGQDFGFALFGAGSSADRDQLMTRIYSATSTYKPPRPAAPPKPDVGARPSFLEWGMDQFGLMPR